MILLRDQLTRRAGEGSAVLVSSHHLDEVARIADRVLLLAEGRLVGGGPPQAVLRPEVLAGFYGIPFLGAPGTGLVPDFAGVLTAEAAPSARKGARVARGLPPSQRGTYPSR